MKKEDSKKPHVSADWFHSSSTHRLVIYTPGHHVLTSPNSSLLRIWSRSIFPALIKTDTNPGTLLAACVNGRLYFAVALPGPHNNNGRPLSDYDFTLIVRHALDQLPPELPVTVFLPGCKHQLTSEQYEQVLEGLETCSANISIADLEISRN